MGTGWSEDVFICLAGLGLGFESDLGKFFGRGSGANSSSEDVMLMTSESGTGPGLGFFDLVFKFDFGVRPLFFVGVRINFVAIEFRERIFVRSARDGPNLSSNCGESNGLNTDAFSTSEGPAAEPGLFRRVLVA